MKLYLINGFLGSGKTTAIQMACQTLLDNKRKVGVVTNDQGEELVDTAFLKNNNLPTLEVTGGCFCCNYEKLSSAITTLDRNEHPDVIFAESVGSCTDLIATVAKPLNKFYPDLEIVITVLADARLLHALMTNNTSFVSEEVQYVYKQQLAEADIMIVNKIDLLNAEELSGIQIIIEQEYREKLILYQNSTDKRHINTWLIKLESFRQPALRHSLQIDYEVYAKGESLLAWLDQSLEITTVDGSALTVAEELITGIVDRIHESNYLIGHLKYMVDDGKNKSKISYTSIHDQHQDLNMSGSSKSDKIDLLINARIQSTPGQLSDIVSLAINEIIKRGTSRINVKKLSSFQPGYPRPTYRMVD
ncbi:GTP-binding protein [Flavitalea sp.]|nr:GTP-binding protein [Flavitalea sp.]